MEKYPRLLFSYLQRYEDPVVAYKEWESKVLRDTPKDDLNFKKIDVLPHGQKILKWLSSNNYYFLGTNKKIFIQHLRGSLYARIFAYLYPRRKICFAVAQYLHVQNQQTMPSGEEFKNLATTLPELNEVRSIVDNEWPVILADAHHNFNQFSAYYQKIILGKSQGEKRDLEEEIYDDLNNTIGGEDND